MSRNKQRALELRRLGLTLKEIGKELDVSKQAIGQIIGRTGRTANVHKRNEKLLAPYLEVLGEGGERNGKVDKPRRAALVRAKSAARSYRRTHDRKYLNQACWLVRKWDFTVEEFK